MNSADHDIRSAMIRAIGIFGFAGGFVLLSPALRDALGQAALQSTAYLNAHSPYSYIGVVAAAFGIMALLARSATSLR